ncbi:MAG: CDP-diacylglycerol--serine O-phosphatidyltransferase [Puniceicoccales bacterium]|jgi:CDP-diacylglycerol--serine O-phosphatidyltransferase|nr:CDP-diacylglycerol--serine O-phosphatidyltransferase [Puniceicoccales bacterium]
MKSENLDLSTAVKIYLLPSLFTASNLFFGFLAIIRCMQARYCSASEAVSTARYTQAVWFIFLSGICDTLDGRVARMGGKESLFGKEFDSIADAVSFGVAPALMVFLMILSPTEQLPFFRQVGWIFGFLYLLCAAVRLARFNVITHPLLPKARQEKNSHDFLGLPVPAAAGVIISLVLVVNEYDLKKWALLFPPLMALIAWLMVSNICYPSFKKIDWDTETRWKTFLAIASGLALIALLHEISLAVIFLGYVFFGMFRHFIEKRTTTGEKCQR